MAVELLVVRGQGARNQATLKREGDWIFPACNTATTANQKMLLQTTINRATE
jgi:hypothetical protein